jgi:aspartate aminotransferase
VKLSRRVQEVQPSPTLAITAKAKALKAAGENVLSLAAGEPDFPTPPHIRKAAVAAMEAGHTGYAPSAGIVPLRKAVRDLYEREIGIAYGDNQVAVSCGAKHCLYNAFQSVLDPGSEAIIQAPYWVSYPEQVRLAGARPVIIDAPAEGFGLNLPAIEKALSENTRMMVLNSPSNPTGHVLSESDLDAVAQMSASHGFYVISDDIYDKLIYDGRKFVSILQRKPEIKDRTLLINGVSKTYSMTGWRLGYAVGPADVIGAMRKVQDQSTSNATAFVQHAAVEALASDPCIVEEMLKAFDQRRRKLVELLSVIDGVSCAMPAGTFYAFASFSGVLDRKIDGAPIGSSMKLADLLLDRERVATVPGEGFGAPGYIRISFAASMEVIEEAVQRIRRLIDKAS